MPQAVEASTEFPQSGPSFGIPGVRTSYTVVHQGVRLHYAEAGPRNGPLVLLLHGFPDFWYTWRHQIPVLAEAGYHVVAPDMRGYNLSDKPPTVADYRTGVMVDDIVGLIRQLGHVQATLVGHDWGGGVAWEVAMYRPHVLRQLIILNAPHPGTFGKLLKKDWDQRLRSLYMLFFRVPYVPEALILAQPGVLYRRLFYGRILPGNPEQEVVVKAYADALRQPGALTAMLNYYRAIFAYPRDRAPLPRITVPTLVLWGSEDPYLSLKILDGLEHYFDAPYRSQILPGAGHWVQHDRPDNVNDALLRFLSEAYGKPAN